MYPRIFRLFIALIAHLGLCLTLSAQSSSDPEGRALRGYGYVSSEVLEGAFGSVLKIVSESPEKASMLQSKFQSDFSLLPGVKDQTLTLGGSELIALSAEGQGLIVALRNKTSVWIFSAESSDALRSNILKEIPSGLSDWESSSNAEVPMWLDRFDRFGFRFYYRPWERPKGESLETYNFIDEFDYAQAHDRSGFMLWENMNAIDSAEGMTNSAFHSWARIAARERELPVGLNIMAGGRGQGWQKNRYRDETQMKMPQFSGGFHKVGDPHLGGNGFTSWTSERLLDNELGGLQAIVEDYVQNDPNLTTILEPHGELRHGPHDVFMEYGPSADTNYRTYLIEQYKDIDVLNQRWGTGYAAFDEVRVPEVASFLGWNDDAIDLSGNWKLQYEPLPEGKTFTHKDNAKNNRRMTDTQGAPESWFSESFDDSEWGDFYGPGSDQSMLIEQRPAVLRQWIEVPKDWLDSQESVWLYLWDLNLATHDNVQVWLNGTLVGEDTLLHNVPHWTAINVSEELKAGKNLLALRLPKALLGYRMYLSSEPPLEYPNLGKEKNAQWVDFVDWMRWSRVRVAHKSINMIRGITPDHPIVLMAPDAYAGSMLELAKNYGGNFHNTGYMGAFWADYLPTLMRGAQLPFSLEPGGPARSLEQFKQYVGRYSTEGIQGLDYFIHIGSILWNESIREHFEENFALIKLIGKYHAPDTKLAALYSTKANAYTDYPWTSNPDNLKAGYWNWNWRSYLRGEYESDGLAESSFESGDAARYKVIIDTNTCIMDDELLDDIEAYVRHGGTFITFVQTGRHTPEVPDSWPISKLTGFEVTDIDALQDNGVEAKHPRGMRPAEDQSVFSGDWADVNANGLSLKAVSKDATPLMYWDDGSIAVGMRHLGKGTIVQVGCKFNGKDMPDRLNPSASGVSQRVVDTRRLFGQLLAWQGVEPIQCHWLPENDFVILRHFESNNGLYDVWTVWNQSMDASAEGGIELPSSRRKVTWGFDVRTGDTIAIEDGSIDMTLAPLETRIFLTPKFSITKAPEQWFALQQNWWRAATDIESVELKESQHPNSVDLGKDWSILPIEGELDLTMISADYDVSDWGQVNIGVWSTIPEYQGVQHALLRKSFSVPESWTNGEIELWLQSWLSDTFAGTGRVWLDGELILDWTRKGIAGENPQDLLKPGSQHVIAVEIKGEAVLVGTRGTCWLFYRPDSFATIDLAGQWVPSQNTLHDDELIELPGKYNARSIRRSIEIPAELEGMRVRLDVEDTGGMVGVLVNGHWVRRFHHLIGERFELDITPWIQFGASNEIEIAALHESWSGDIKAISLEFYKP